MNHKPSKKRRAPLLSFEEFESAFDSVLKQAARTEKKSGILQFLSRRTGFSLSKDQTTLILSRIRQLTDPDPLEFAILVESRLNPRASAAVTCLAAEVASRYRAETRFLEHFDEGALHISPAKVQEWLSGLAASSKGQAGTYLLLSPSVLRAAFGCLLTQVVQTAS